MSMTNVRETENMVRPPVKKPRDIVLAFRVTTEMKKALERAAGDDNRSVSGLVVNILMEWLRARKLLK
jgi:hypothetical protein